MTAAPRTDPRWQRTHERALEAARLILLDRGLDAVTHAEVALASGVGRRSAYRHWPTREALVRDTLSGVAVAPLLDTDDVVGDVRRHLVAFQRALVEGPLGYVVAAINERAARQGEYVALRRELAREGCRPLQDRLRAAIADGQLPGRRLADVPDLQARLEGPILYAALMSGVPYTRARIARLVDDVLTHA